MTCRPSTRWCAAKCKAWPTAPSTGAWWWRDPQNNIRAGVRYLEWTWNRFPDLAPGPRLWFALAAYNAGAGHVREARRVARQQNLDANAWFDNVERGMLLLAEEPWASQSMHGYVRAAEPVRYVRQIRDRYRAYLDHFRVLDEDRIASETPRQDPEPE